MLPDPITAAPSKPLQLLFAITIFLSAFLLFSLEPLIAKQILPWFGGSAAVWATCLVFYQVVLLGGYAYAAWLQRCAGVRMPAAIHVAIVGISLLFLPIGPGVHWRSAAVQHPDLAIIGMLGVSVALPFLVLSATSPLLQSLLGAAGHKTPYRLFAVSNFASLAALIAYPFAVEPAFDMHQQRIWWSVLYVAFALLCSYCTFVSRRLTLPRIGRENTSALSFVGTRKLLCFSLSAAGSMLLLALTNHLTENMAPVPLLWILPLAVYLLTFVLAFGREGLYRRALWLRFLAVSLGVLGYAIYDITAVEAIQVSIPVTLVGLFVCCLFCHGELNQLRPDPDRLTEFYLLIAAGGACGAIFVGLVAPSIFTGIYELPLALTAIASLALVVIWPSGEWPARLLWCSIVVATLVLVYTSVQSYEKNTLSVRRSFYGSLRVVQSPLAGERQTRTLFHGTIEHGAQFLLPPMRFRPTTYYGPESGIGIVLRECFPNPMRVGAVGLGAGTLAAYGRPGDAFVFYEINQQVEDMATSLFFYLRESRAKTQIVTGDARLSLEAERNSQYDVIAIDAFSGDAIPVHLITHEAMNLYLKHLNPDGVLAFHVSNNFLDLAGVVKQLASASGYSAVASHNHQDDEHLVLPSDWVIVTRNESVLQNASLRAHSIPIVDRSHFRLWTDNYNNLLQILRTPSLSK